MELITVISLFKSVEEIEMNKSLVEQLRISFKMVSFLYLRELFLYSCNKVMIYSFYCLLITLVRTFGVLLHIMYLWMPIPAIIQFFPHSVV